MIQFLILTVIVLTALNIIQAVLTLKAFSKPKESENQPIGKESTVDVEMMIAQQQFIKDYENISSYDGSEQE